MKTRDPPFPPVRANSRFKSSRAWVAVSFAQQPSSAVTDSFSQCKIMKNISPHFSSRKPIEAY